VRDRGYLEVLKYMATYATAKITNRKTQGLVDSSIFLRGSIFFSVKRKIEDRNVYIIL